MIIHSFTLYLDFESVSDRLMSVTSHDQVTLSVQMLNHYLTYICYNTLSDGCCIPLKPNSLKCCGHYVGHICGLKGLSTVSGKKFFCVRHPPFFRK